MALTFIRLKGHCRYTDDGSCKLAVTIDLACPPTQCDPPRMTTAPPWDAATEERMTTRQMPEIDATNNQRRWTVWGIVTQNGLLAEVTMDPEKAKVWKAGNHKVLDFVFSEPFDGVAAEAPDGQGTLL